MSYRVSSETRLQARISLQGKWGQGALATLVFFSFCLVLGFVNVIPVVGAILAGLVGFVLIVGFDKYFLKVSCGVLAELEDISWGFERFGKVLGTQIIKNLYILLWSLPVVIIEMFADTAQNSDLRLLAIPFYVLFIIARLKYAMVSYILIDNPDMPALEIVKASNEMMKGNKGRLIVLQLTFIGWGLLTILTFGIGMFWLAPYYQTAMATFYNELVEDDEIEDAFDFEQQKVVQNDAENDNEQ